MAYLYRVGRWSAYQPFLNLDFKIAEMRRQRSEMHRMEPAGLTRRSDRATMRTVTGGAGAARVKIGSEPSWNGRDAS